MKSKHYKIVPGIHYTHEIVWRKSINKNIVTPDNAADLTSEKLRLGLRFMYKKNRVVRMNGCGLDCAYCQINVVSDTIDCKDCIVKDVTGKPDCKGTGFRKYVRGLHSSDVPMAIEGAIQMLETLSVVEHVEHIRKKEWD